MTEQHVRLSKFLSLVLRHKPESIGVEMDDAGWVSIPQLIAKSQAAGKPLTEQTLNEIVQSDAKTRYCISEDGMRIRANQGHSVAVSLDWKRSVPPPRLYHGTHEGVVAIILKTGLQKMRRHHVHLSVDQQTAMNVGARRGKVVVFEINTRQMVKDGIPFFLAENGVWLTDYVAPEYLKIVETS